MDSTGKLYFVPTPVGNLADMSERAIATLRHVDIIYAEDTRTSGSLLKHFNIDTPLKSFHKFNEHSTLDAVIANLNQGLNVALISDAGTPGISDPGFLLSRAARDADIAVETLPGPTAFVPALVNSGLPCERFCFEGFLPQKKGRESRLRQIAEEPRTSIIYESPLRLLKTLTALRDLCGADRPCSVSREISKIYDQTVRGTLAEIIEHFSLNQPRGEIVIVLGGHPGVKRSSHINKYKTNINNYE